MSSCEELGGVDCSGLGEVACDYTHSITRRAQVLNRQLKSIENVSSLIRGVASFQGLVLLIQPPLGPVRVS